MSKQDLMAEEALLHKIDNLEMTEDTKNLLISMENYMQKIFQKELQAFDDYIEEKLQNYSEEAVNYEEVGLLRKQFYDRIKSRMLSILEEAFINNNNKEMQQFFIEKLYTDSLDEAATSCEEKEYSNEEEEMETPGLSQKQIYCLKEIGTVIDEENEEMFGDSPLCGPYEEEINGIKCVYQGQYDGDRKSGLGKLILEDETYAEGEFNNDQPHGFQRIITKDAKIFEGKIYNQPKTKTSKQNLEIQGYLTSYPGKSTSKARNKGIGVASYKNGCKYEGAFTNGLRHGYGEFYNNQGGVFKGFWKNDHRHGEGFFFDSAGSLFKQIWKVGKLIEESKITDKG